MTVVLTVPSTTVPAGPGKTAAASVSPTSVSNATIKLMQVGWPGAGDVAFTIIIDVSQDGGTTWTTISTSEVYDSPIPSFRGSTANQVILSCTIPGAGNANRKVRMSWNFAKSLTISGTLEVS